jgi:hypothetical protein
VTNEHRTIIELSDAEQDLVAGGCSCDLVLIQGNGDPNFNANSPNTPAAENGHGFSGNRGARIDCAPL